MDGEDFYNKKTEKQVAYLNFCTKCHKELRRDEYHCTNCNEVNFIENKYVFKHKDIEYTFIAYEHLEPYCDGYYIALNGFEVKNNVNNILDVIVTIKKLIIDDKLIIGDYGIIIKEPNGTLDVFNNDYYVDHHNNYETINYHYDENVDRIVTPCPFSKDAIKDYSASKISTVKVGSNMCRECEFFESANDDYETVRCNYRKF